MAKGGVGEGDECLAWIDVRAKLDRSFKFASPDFISIFLEDVVLLEILGRASVFVCTG